MLNYIAEILRRETFPGLNSQVFREEVVWVSRWPCFGSRLEKRAVSKGPGPEKLEACEREFLAPLATVMPFPVIAQALR